MLQQPSPSQRWYIPLIRGIFSLAFGLAAIFLPGLTLIALIYVFAAYALSDGAMTIYQSITERGKGSRWIWGLVEGIISLAAGIGAILLPQITGFALLFLIAFYAILTGIMQIVSAIQLRKEIENEIWMGFAGLISILFGALILFDPLGGALATAWLIGVYALSFGTMLIAFSIRLRSIDGDTPQGDNIAAGSNA